MKNEKGFTLVELLAIIVILGILMTLAIPAVQRVLKSSQKKTFVEYAEKIAQTAQTKYNQDIMKEEISDSDSVIYDVKKDLKLSSTGDYNGYVLVTEDKIYVTLYDNNYAVYGVDYNSINTSNIQYRYEVTDRNLTIESLAKETGTANFKYIKENKFEDKEVELKKAIFDKGQTINVQLKNMVTGTTDSKTDTNESTVEHIKYTQNIDSAPSNKITISSASSELPIYAWWVSSEKTIYIGSKSEKVFLNQDATMQFQRFINLKDIDLSHYYSDDTQSLYRFLAENTNLESVDMRHFNTSKVTNFRALFMALKKVTKIDVSNFNTDNAQKMGYMFYNIPLVTELDLSKFNTSKVTDMERMFAMTGLRELHIETFDTSKITNMNYLFYQNTSLEKIYVSNKFVTTNVKQSTGMFEKSKKLNGAYDPNKTTHQYASLYLTYV